MTPCKHSGTVEPLAGPAAMSRAVSLLQRGWPYSTGADPHQDGKERKREEGRERVREGGGRGTEGKGTVREERPELSHADNPESYQL